VCWSVLESRSAKDVDMPVSVSTEFMNPFLFASFSVLSTLFGEMPVKGAVTSESETGKQPLNVIVEVGGAVNGYVGFGMSEHTATQIASKMSGQPVSELDALAESALAEFANMICGNGLEQLSDFGHECSLMPPKVFHGPSEPMGFEGGVGAAPRTGTGQVLSESLFAEK